MKIELYSPVTTPEDPEVAEAKLMDFSPEPHRAEVPLVAPDGSTLRVILLDADDSFDVIIQDQNGDREAVWSLVKEEEDLPEIPIRNYQGEIPEGTWYCNGCDYRTSILQSAARHAEKNDSWVHLFPHVVSSNTPALMEMHPGDYIEGVYLNMKLGVLTWGEFFRRRDREMSKTSHTD